MQVRTIPPKAPKRNRASRVFHILTEGDKVKGVRSRFLQEFLKDSLGISDQFYFRYLSLVRSYYPEAFPASKNKESIPVGSCYILWSVCLFSILIRKEARQKAKRGEPQKRIHIQFFVKTEYFLKTGKVFLKQKNVNFNHLWENPSLDFYGKHILENFKLDARRSFLNSFSMFLKNLKNNTRAI